MQFHIFPSKRLLVVLLASRTWPRASPSSTCSSLLLISKLHALELLLLLLGEERRVAFQNVHARALRCVFPREELLGARAQLPRLQPRGLVHGLHLDVAELADVRFLLKHGAQALRRGLLTRGLGLLLGLFLSVGKNAIGSTILSVKRCPVINMSLPLGHKCKSVTQRTRGVLRPRTGCLLGALRQPRHHLLLPYHWRV